MQLVILLGKLFLFVIQLHLYNLHDFLLVSHVVGIPCLPGCLWEFLADLVHYVFVVILLLLQELHLEFFVGVEVLILLRVAKLLFCRLRVL